MTALDDAATRAQVAATARQACERAAAVEPARTAQELRELLEQPQK